MGWTAWGSNSNRSKRFSLLQNSPDRLLALVQWVLGFFPRDKAVRA